MLRGERQGGENERGVRGGRQGGESHAIGARGAVRPGGIRAAGCEKQRGEQGPQVSESHEIGRTGNK